MVSGSVRLSKLGVFRLAVQINVKFCSSFSNKDWSLRYTCTEAWLCRTEMSKTESSGLVFSVARRGFPVTTVSAPKCTPAPPTLKGWWSILQVLL